MLLESAPNMLKPARVLFLIVAITLPAFLFAAEPKRDGDWISQEDASTGILLNTMELTITPRSEPVPAFKHRLLASESDLLEGNAAIFYLKAIGFVGHEGNRKNLQDFFERQQEIPHSDWESLPPHGWLNLPMRDFPQEAVRDYLENLKFQEPLIAEATRRRYFTVDRQIDHVDNPISYPLHDIQGMRELVRNQSLRCRLALSENRLEDALRILSQQFTIANHLSQEEFLIPQLIGCAMIGVAWDDALAFSQQADAPNLYWAYAALPKPFFHHTAGVEFESQMLFHQFKALREVDETLRPDAYWNDLIDRILPRMKELGTEARLGDILNDDIATSRTILLQRISESQHGARKYLTEHCQLASEQVSAMSDTHVVFLALVRFYERNSAEQLKWIYLPFWQARTYSPLDDDITFKSQLEQLGWVGSIAELVIGDFDVLATARARVDQKIALLQTVEAIRLYGAAHNSQLPRSLADLPVPAPLDPCTGQPLQYDVQQNGKAILTGHPFAAIQWRLVIQFAAPEPTVNTP